MNDAKLFSPSKSSKICSTISYNTESFLKEKLDMLINSNVLTFWAYIVHKGEYDAELKKRDKNHIHLYLVPNGRLDRGLLRDYFKEVELGNPKPLGVLAIVNSKFYDWYHYCCHNERYLEQKKPNEVNKEFHYSRNDFVTSDLVYFNNEISTNLFQYSENDLVKKEIMLNPSASNVEIALRANPQLPMKNLAFTAMGIEQARNYFLKQASVEYAKEKSIEFDSHKSSDELVLDSGEVVDVGFDVSDV